MPMKSTTKQEGTFVTCNLEREFIEGGVHSLLGPVPKGWYEKLTIKDTGQGIEEKMVDEIIDPYYSTKNERSGKGIGLCLVSLVVQHMNGHLFISSDKNNGASVSVIFPECVTS